jgi:hypothetical protein
MQDSGTLATSSHTSLVDFDQWADLAKTDPAAFEARRAEVIEAAIQQMPSHKQHRMRCLQWKIDQVRGQASTPLAACIRLSEMMWDSMVGPGGLRDVLEGVGNNFQLPTRAPVVPLKPRR